MNKFQNYAVNNDAGVDISDPADQSDNSFEDDDEDEEEEDDHS